MVFASVMVFMPTDPFVEVMVKHTKTGALYGERPVVLASILKLTEMENAKVCGKNNKILAHI